MGYCLYRPQPFEAGPGAESVRSVADSCWSRIKARDKVELKLGCGNYDPQTPPSTLDSISLKDYPDRLLVIGFLRFGRDRAQEKKQGTLAPRSTKLNRDHTESGHPRARLALVPPSMKT